MAAPRDRRHILVSTARRNRHDFTRPSQGGSPKPPPGPASRLAHGQALKTSFEQAVVDAQVRRAQAQVEVQGAQPGVYVEFEGVQLDLQTLENKTKGIEIVAVSEIAGQAGAAPRQRATVFVPDEKTDHFTKRLDTYSDDTTKAKGEIRHEKMLDPVTDIRLGTLRGLWTDSSDVYPEDQVSIWWEVWLRRHDEHELERFMEYCGLVNLTLGDKRLQFDDRIVLLVRATPAQLAGSLDVLQDVAEVRKAKEAVAFFVELGPAGQAEWAEDLVERTTPAPADAPAVTILDTGVTRGHPLLEHSLAKEDAHSVDPDWGAHDNGGGPGMAGHGTQMAGLALYGDLAGVLPADAPVRLRHRAETVKILPPEGAAPNSPQLYGTITAEAAARVEVQAPQRRRCFSLAVTADDVRDRGRPTSWSAAIDALAVGRSFDQTTQGLSYLDDDADPPRRLFIVSAGNMRGDDLQVDHLVQSDLRSIQDPAHAWNALTVGACTDLVSVTDPDYAGWAPLAPPGELSPYSTTSVLFADPWPLKPDVVFEGGNIIHRNGATQSPIADLSVLTTHHLPMVRLFTASNATSAATAQVARLAAILSAEYPDYWPETIRALIVHSARWTPRMDSHLHEAGGKGARARLVRRYGYGVPSLERAIRSATDALTLVVQDRIRPYADGKTRDIHLYNLPWPKEALEGLGEQQVRLRVTLSYFVEPNPARRGWQKRYQYASHGLRFKLRGPTDRTEDFHKRINQAVREEGEKSPGGEGLDWYLGRARDKGSIHSDHWEGNAADLAECSVIGVFPVGGWWKERKDRDRSEQGVPYTLVVGIETGEEEADVWTPVATEVGVPVESVDIEL